MQYAQAFGAVADLTAQFFSGLGPSDNTFGSNSSVSQVMAQSPGVQDAINAYNINGTTSGTYKAQGMADTGSDNYGGPVVTAGGLLFIAATVFDQKFHAYDKNTGKLLWETDLPFSGLATPSTYMVNGKQYVVVPAGGGQSSRKPSGGVYVAYALP
jgi:glucose dehydrogenase